MEGREKNWRLKKIDLILYLRNNLLYLRNNDNPWVYIAPCPKRQRLRSSYRGVVRTWIDGHLHQIRVTLLIASRRRAISGELACTRAHRCSEIRSLYKSHCISRLQSHTLDQMHLSPIRQPVRKATREISHSNFYRFFYWTSEIIYWRRDDIRVPDCRLDGDRDTSPRVDADLPISQVNQCIFR